MGGRKKKDDGGVTKVKKASARDSAPPISKQPLTDEGILYEWVDHQNQTIVNLATDRLDARRRELHINGRAFSHVSDNNAGQWIYRYDK